MKEYIKNLTIKDIERNTENVLWYLERATNSIKEGKSPVMWIAHAIEYAANLQEKYASADNLEIYDSLDFEKIYNESLESARKEIEQDE